MSYLFMKLSFIHLIRFRGDDARVFQPLVKPHARYQARSQGGVDGGNCPPPNSESFTKNFQGNQAFDV